MRGRNLCDHKRERKKAKGLQSIQFRRHTEAAAQSPWSAIFSSPGLSGPCRLRYPLPGGPDSGMPQVGCGGFVVAFALMKLFEASHIHDDIPKPAFKIRQTKRATLVLSTFAAMLSALVWLLVQKLD